MSDDETGGWPRSSTGRAKPPVRGEHPTSDPGRVPPLVKKDDAREPTPAPAPAGGTGFERKEPSIENEGRRR